MQTKFVVLTFLLTQFSLRSIVTPSAASSSHAIQDLVALQQRQLELVEHIYSLSSMPE